MITPRRERRREVEPGDVGRSRCPRPPARRRPRHRWPGDLGPAAAGRPQLAGSGREARLDQAHPEFHRGHVRAERAHGIQRPRQRVHTRRPAPGPRWSSGRRRRSRRRGSAPSRRCRCPGRRRPRRWPRRPPSRWTSRRASAGVQRVGGVPDHGVRARRTSTARPGWSCRRSWPRTAGPRPPRPRPGRRFRLLRDHLAAHRGGQALDIDAVLDREPRAVARRVQPHDPGGIHGEIGPVRRAVQRSHGAFLLLVMATL
jgi:hypothetical protein